MNRYTTLSTVEFPAGTVLSLDKSQAAARVHVLARKTAKGNVYITTGRVCFKRGETFGYEGDLPKQIADCLDKAREVAENPASEGGTPA